MSPREAHSIIAKPATIDRWGDLQAVFGPQGAYSGCWCMYWRLKRRVFDQAGAASRKAGLRTLCRREQPPGLIYYDQSHGGDAIPFGWASLGPREDFPVLQRSPLMRPVDTLPTWSFVCFYLLPTHREKGMFRHLVKLGVEYARDGGAARIEAYPREHHRSGMTGYMGVAEVLRSLGFEEIARRKPDRPVLRLEIAR